MLSPEEIAEDDAAVFAIVAAGGAEKDRRGLTTPWQRRIFGALVDVGHKTVSRGLMIKTGGDVYVLTACHALPYTPDNEAPLPQILSRPGKRPQVGASVLFADQVADVALLGSPSSNQFSRDEYDNLASTAVEITIGSDLHQGSVAMPTRLETDLWLNYDNGKSVRRRINLTGPNHSVMTMGLSGSPMFDVHSRLVGVYIGRASDRAFAAPVSEVLPTWFMRAMGG